MAAPPAQTTTASMVQQALDGCADCPGFAGAVVATADGLVLASCGGLSGDAPAASAASLALHATSALAALGPHRPVELMIWSDQRLWFLTCIAQAQQPPNPQAHLLLVASNEVSRAGALRITAQRAARQLANVLDGL